MKRHKPHFDDEAKEEKVFINETNSTNTNGELPALGTKGLREKEKKFVKRLAKAKIDGLFVKRLVMIMKRFSGTRVFSLVHLYFWQIVFAGMLMGQCTNMQADWLSRSQSKLSEFEYY
jgi:hypothetical protein